VHTCSTLLQEFYCSCCFVISLKCWRGDLLSSVACAYLQQAKRFGYKRSMLGRTASIGDSSMTHFDTKKRNFTEPAKSLRLIGVLKWLMQQRPNLLSTSQLESKRTEWEAEGYPSPTAGTRAMWAGRTSPSSTRTGKRSPASCSQARRNRLGFLYITRSTCAYTRARRPAPSVPSVASVASAQPSA